MSDSNPTVSSNTTRKLVILEHCVRVFCNSLFIRKKSKRKGNAEMKRSLEWFIVPCVATIFGGGTMSLNAQDPPKLRRVVVVGQAQNEADAKSLQERVAKELEKSGIAAEDVARILKDVENSLKKAKGVASKAKKSIEVELKLKGGSPVTQKLFTTHFFRDPKSDGYRIGIQCSQVDAEEGDDEKESRPGLEVKAVFDDSPAKKAGIEEGDILVSVNGFKINKIADLTDALQEAGKGEKEVTIEVKRDDKVVSVTVKPTKMKSSDIELENIDLFPAEGFVFDGDVMKSFQEHMKNLSPKNLSSGFAHVLNLQSNSVDLKKDMDELKTEIAELKKLIKELVDKK